MAAFGGRGTSPVIERLKEQDGLYTLVTRGGACDGFEVVGSISRAHGAAEHEAWLGYFEAPELAAVTITITEAGYRRRAGGGLDLSQPDVQADLGALHRDPRALVRTAPARLLAGIIARRSADGGPLSIVPCDNVSGNGAMVERVLRDAAELLDPAAAAWIAGSISFVTTIVDRITPRTAAQDVRTVLDSNGWDDRCPVVTEPFHEWVLSGEFPASRPRWEDAGATFTADIARMTSASCGSSTAGTRCWPTQARSGATKRWPLR
jgi:fructuronate reductase